MSEAREASDRLLTGVLLGLLSFGSLAVMSALAKAAAGNSPVEVTVFFQNLICFLIIAPVALRSGFGPLKTRQLPLHLLRAATGTAAWFGLFFAISLIPLTNAVLLTYSAPIFLPLIAWLVSRQAIGVQIWAGVLLGFLGIALVLNPTGSPIEFGDLLALGAALLLALALLSVRWLGRTEPTVRILFYYFGLSTLGMLPLALSSWSLPDDWGWAYILGIGLCLMLSQIFIILAYRAASPVKLAPLIYSVIVFTALIDAVIWDQVPSLLEVAGMILVIVGGAVAMVERPAKSRRSAA